MDGTDEPVARSGDDGTDVRKVEDVGLLTTNPTSDVEMADNETAEDALETVGAIIADITSAAVSASTTDVDTATGLMPTASSQSETIITDVDRIADVKACAEMLPLEVTASDKPATCVVADVKEAGSDEVTEMDTDAHADVTAVVGPDTDVTKMDPGIADVGEIDSDVVHNFMDTDLHTNGALPVKTDTPVASSTKNTTTPVAADGNIKPLVITDKAITIPDTIDKDIAAPVTIDKDIMAPVTIDTEITAPVTTGNDIAAPVTIDKDSVAPITIDKDIAAHITIDKAITAPVTIENDISSPVTTDKDITPPATTDKHITSPVTADNSAPLASDGNNTVPLVANIKTAAMEVPIPSNSESDLPPNETLKPPETLSANMPEPLLLENITEKTDGNDTSMEDFSNLSLPSFSESKSSVDQKFAGTISECSFQKQRSLSEKSNIEDSSKGLPAIRGERDVSSLGDKLVNMQRPFRNIGESSGIIDDAGKYLDDGMPSFAGSRGVPLELPNSSSSKDLTLMMSAKDAMIMPDDSQHDSCNVDNIEIIQLIEDTTSASVSMDVNRSLASKVEPTKDVSAVLLVADEQSAEDSVPVSVAEDSLLSKDSIDKSDLKVVEAQAVAPTELSAEVVPEDSCKSEASGKEANGGDVDMVEESQPDASGEGDKQGTDVDGSEREEDGEGKDKKLSKSAKKRRPGICAETEEEDSQE